jgi:hypothetical protein
MSTPVEKMRRSRTESPPPRPTARKRLIAAEMDVELVDVELVKEPTGHFLRFYIEKPDGVKFYDATDVSG